jgi:uncharacterized protein (TIGR01244 family)
MRNARKYNDRVTIGGVPDQEDLAQLKDLGYKTLIDLREESEKFGGLARKTAEEMGLKFTDIPINRSGIKIEDVKTFYREIYAKGSAPIYAFSRFGRKPLAFLLLFDGVANHEKGLIHKVIRRSSEFGINLEGDLVLQEFLIELLASGDMEPIIQSIRELRPDLLHG